MKKNETIKLWLTFILGISIICQINIAISDLIKANICRKKIDNSLYIIAEQEKEQSEYKLPPLPKFEVIDEKELK